MSYKKLSENKALIFELNGSIKKYRDLAHKIQLAIKEKKKRMDEIHLENLALEKELLFSSIKPGDTLVAVGWSKLMRRGDIIEVIRVNKKSITFKIIDVSKYGSNFKVGSEAYSQNEKRLGNVLRLENRNLHSLFTQLETSIKREEKLRSLIK